MIRLSRRNLENDIASGLGLGASLFELRPHTSLFGLRFQLRPNTSSYDPTRRSSSYDPTSPIQLRPNTSGYDPTRRPDRSLSL